MISGAYYQVSCEFFCLRGYLISQDLIIGHISDMATTIEDILNGLHEKAVERFVDAMQKAYRGAITHSKPMDTASERFIFNASIRLGTISLPYDCEIRHWDDVLQRVRDDTQNVIALYIHPPLDMPNKEMVALTTASSLQRIFGLNEETRRSLLGHRAKVSA